MQAPQAESFSSSPSHPDWQGLLARRASGMKASEIRELLKLLDQPDILSFAGGIPDPALFPAKAFADAIGAILSGPQAAAALQYSLSEGYLPLRQWLANRMAGLGIACGPENIFISSGSQQALDYLGKMFLSEGDGALVPFPAYLGALQAFNAYQPVYGRLDSFDNRPAADLTAQADARGGKLKFAYLSADFANPTGETLSKAARLALLERAQALDIAIIEDGAYQDLRYDGEAVPPILALDMARCGSIENARTIYCGSFSKTLSPGLRTGFVVAPQAVVQRLVLIKQASDLHSPTLNQMAIHAVAEAGFDDQTARTRAVYCQRRDHLLSALETFMPDGVTWTRPEGGMFVWLRLPEGIDGAALLKRSIETARVAFVPGKAFFADGSGANHIRLSFSCATPETIHEGMKRLAPVIAEMAGMGTG